MLDLDADDKEDVDVNVDDDTGYINGSVNVLYMCYVDYILQ